MDLLVVALTVLVAQTVRGVTGFGSALITVPVVAAVWSPAEAVLLATSLDLVGGAMLLPPVRSRVRWTLVAAVVVAMIPGQVAGTLLVHVLPQRAVRLVVGLVVAALGVEAMVWPVRPGVGELADLPDPPGPVLRQGAAAGVVAGLFQGVVGTPGPPIVVFGRRLFRDDFFRAQLLAIFVGGGLTLIATVVASGAGSVSLWTRVALLAPVVLIGARVGAAFAPRVDRVAFGRLVGLLLVAAAALLIRAAFLH